MSIWEIETINQLFMKGSYAEIIFFENLIG